jgi:hypothetical protein
LCGFPPTSDTVTLRVPNGAWRPDTVITDYEGTEMFVLLDQTQEMRSYEAVFGDLEGRRLVCIKRHVIKAFWKDGYYFCTYRPNYAGQLPLKDRDVDNKKVYPFSYLQVNPMKGRFFYRYFDNQGGLSPPKMRADNPWLGFMVVCCTPMVRCGKWTASFKRRSLNAPSTIHVDQWRNCVDVGPGNDVLAALCMAYVFDRYQCQPLVTVFGVDDEDDGDNRDDKSINTHEPGQTDPLAGIGDYGPPTQYKDGPRGGGAGSDRATGGGNNNAPPPPASYDPSTGLYYDENGQQQPYGGGQYGDDGLYYDNNNAGQPGADGPFYDDNGQAGQYDNDVPDGRGGDSNNNDNNGGAAGAAVPYYDEQGQVYYLDEQTGQPYYLDEQTGQPYYLDEQGQPYYLDEQGQPYYLDEQGQPYYLDEQGQPYYANDADGAGEPFYDDDGQPNGVHSTKPAQQPPVDLLDDNDDNDGRTRPTIV